MTKCDKLNFIKFRCEFFLDFTEQHNNNISLFKVLKLSLKCVKQIEGSFILVKSLIHYTYGVIFINK